MTTPSTSQDSWRHSFTSFILSAEQTSPLRHSSATGNVLQPRLVSTDSVFAFTSSCGHSFDFGLHGWWIKLYLSLCVLADTQSSGFTQMQPDKPQTQTVDSRTYTHTHTLMCYNINLLCLSKHPATGFSLLTCFFKKFISFLPQSHTKLLLPVQPDVQRQLLKWVTRGR